MKTLDKLNHWKNRTFSSGSTTGDDYKQFQKELVAHIRAIAKAKNLTVVAVNRGHYYMSAFLTNISGEKTVYLSISDVRHFPDEWHNHMLIRTARDAKDFRGGTNQYTTLEDLDAKLDSMLN